MARSDVLTSAFLLLLSAACTASYASDAVCTLAKKPFGLNAFIVDTKEDELGNVEIAADFDGDGRKDNLLWFRTGSASVLPPDNSRITLTLSASGISYFVEGQWVSLAKYRKRYYALTTSVLTESPTGPWRTTIYSIAGRGLLKLCSFSGPTAQRERSGG